MEIKNSCELLLVSPCRAEVTHGQARGYCGVPHPGPSQDLSESSCPLTASELYCRMREPFCRTELIFLCSKVRMTVLYIDHLSACLIHVHLDVLILHECSYLNLICSIASVIGSLYVAATSL